ncbi:MAG: OmpA family protein [Planctomycetota bacterium]|nr:OmpA family protein [Planctomycetota bacterium]
MATSQRRGVQLILVLGMLASAALLTGCIGQGQYDKLYETNSSLTRRNAELTRERDEARAQIELMRRSVGSNAGTLSDLQRQNDELRRQLEQALADYRTLEQRIAAFDFGPVDAETDQALAALAAQYPDLIRYDPARGMLRFASDLTFDSGSDAVKENARQALGALAQILNSASASAYDVIIEGHTDSQRIANPATLREHRTNRRLSAHRSIAVIDELGKLGVASDRMMAAGWGEHRPAVPNTASGNTPQNRRVEIFLVRSTGSRRSTESAEPAPTPTPTTPSGPAIDLTK